MNIDKMKAELERLNLRQQQAEQKARDLQTKIQEADKTTQTRRKIVLGAWVSGIINSEEVQKKLRGYIADKDKGLFPDIFTPDEIKAAKERTLANKVKGGRQILKKSVSHHTPQVEKRPGHGFTPTTRLTIKGCLPLWPPCVVP